MKTLNSSRTLLVLIMALVVRVASGQTMSGPSEPALSSNDTKAVFDKLISNIQEHCAFKDEAENIVRALKSQWAKGAYKNGKTSDVLVSQLQRDIDAASTKGLIKIAIASRVPEPTVPTPRTLAEQQYENFSFREVKIMPGNVGYMIITDFSPVVEQSRQRARDAFAFVSRTQAVVIDLRRCSGESTEMVKLLAGFFYKEPRSILRVADKSGVQIIDTDPKNSNGVFLPMPLYLLTSRATARSAEDFVLAMQSSKRAVVIGDTTRGESKRLSNFSIGSNFTVSIPVIYSADNNGKVDRKGTGIIPDQTIEMPLVLKATIEDVFGKRLNQSSRNAILAEIPDPLERKTIEWFLNSIKAQRNAETVPSDVLAKYEGVYAGGLQFYQENGGFYCRNPERGNRVYQLSAVTTNLFVLDENVQVEFVVQHNETLSNRMLLHWASGFESAKDREKKN